MKNLIAWTKSHIAIVSCTALIVVSLPVAWYFSSGWNTQIRDKQQGAAQQKLTEVENSKVTYTLPRLSANDPTIEVSGAPNQTLTDWFKLHRDKILAQAQGIVQEAERINKRAHAPLVAGLLPKAASSQEAQVKALELAEKVVYLPGKESNVYAQLLKRIGAGEPPVSADVAAAVADERNKLVEQITGGTKRELTPEEKERVDKATVEKRLAEYRGRAADLSVYATMDVFPSGGNDMGSFVPRTMPVKPPSLDECFFWQYDYWLVSDVLDAIALANRDATGSPTSIDRSVVKRIDRLITSDNWIYIFSGGGSQGIDPSSGEAAAPVEPGSPDALIESKFDRSITGRWSGPGNAVYDVRNVSLSVVVSSARLPELINAFARTNFMTVTDVDLSDVDVWTDLDQGYFYGSEHVVRARMVIETVWLRSWTTPLMPAKVRSILSIPEDPKEEGKSDEPAADGEPVNAKSDGEGR